MTIDTLLEWVRPWLFLAGTMLALVLLGLGLHALLYAVARRLAARTASAFDELLVAETRAPARLLVPLLLVNFAWSSSGLALKVQAFGQRLLTILFIVTAAWLIVRALRAVTRWTTQRFRIDVDDNLRAREVQTKAMVLQRSASLVVVVVAAALVLMQFPGIENVGASLLASAGVAGLAVGLAARPALTNLLAGLQLALTQPIRIDDVVIVEGEWGRIEEIRNTFVIVRIWDLRRLVVPLSYFIEKPFQNWTRVTADLLGTVFVHVDYTTPVGTVRDELKRILDASGLWDGKVWNLQVTESNEHTVQLRALMSAPDASTAWDLRCLVRERLIEYLQREHPRALPRNRAELLAQQDATTAPAPAGPARHRGPAGSGSGSVTTDGISSIDGRS